MPAFLLLLTLTACPTGKTGESGETPPDATEFLIGVADLHATLLVALIFDGIVACGGPDLWNRKEDDASWKGVCSVPDPTGDDYGISGEIALQASVVASREYYAGNWDWTLDAGYTDVTAGGATFTGTGTLVAQSSSMEHFSHQLEWNGQLSGPWPSEVNADLVALFSGNVHELTGHVGDEAVDYTNPNPDVP